MIYFVQEAGNHEAPIKIGYTSANPEKRVRELQTGYPAKLTVLASLDGDPAKESTLHRRWAHLRLHGEWFRADEALLVYISEIKDIASVTKIATVRSPVGEHEWVENSGTTDICRRCGCIRYCCNCCTQGEVRYDQWSQKARDWTEDVWKATAAIPVCDSSRPVPDWVRNKAQG